MIINLTHLLIVLIGLLIVVTIYLNYGNFSTNIRNEIYTLENQRLLNSVKTIVQEVTQNQSNVIKADNNVTRFIINSMNASAYQEAKELELLNQTVLQNLDILHNITQLESNQLLITNRIEDILSHELLNISKSIEDLIIKHDNRWNLTELKK